MSSSTSAGGIVGALLPIIAKLSLVRRMLSLWRSCRTTSSSSLPTWWPPVCPAWTGRPVRWGASPRRCPPQWGCRKDPPGRICPYFDILAPNVWRLRRPIVRTWEKATRFLSGASLLRQVLQHSSTWQCHVSPLPTASTLLPPPHLSGLKVTSGSELLLRHRWVGWQDVYSGPPQLQLHTFLSLDPPGGQCGSLGPAEQRLPVRQEKPLHHETHFRSFN